MIIAERLKKVPPYPFTDIETKEKEALAQGIDVISFGIGEPNISPPPSIIKSLLLEANKPKNHYYPEYEGSLDFRQNVAKWYKKRYDVSLNTDHEILALIGSKEGIANVLLAYINPGDYVLIPDPSYPVYKSGTIFAGGEPYLMPLLSKNNFFPDFRMISKNVLRRAKVMFLNYPNNPTAAVADIKFFKEAVNFCKKNNIILCHDAAYSEISFDGYSAPSILQVEGAKDIAIEFNTFSKSFSIPGWRMGFAAGNSEIIKALKLSKVILDSGQFRAIQYSTGEALLKNFSYKKDLCNVMASGEIF